ncbi:hypothetical protein CH313_25215 [Streptomyces sp. TSRI0384-2]|nr:hypothetical protein CH313_25215 [Streptomyces sp. TSRI0384-2]
MTGHRHEGVGAMPEDEHQAERRREDTDESSPATVIECGTPRDDDGDGRAEPSAGERRARDDRGADRTSAGAGEASAADPDGRTFAGASVAGPSLAKSTDTEPAVTPASGAPEPRTGAPAAATPDGAVAADAAAAGVTAEPRERRDLWAPPDPADRSPGPAPYGAQPLGASPGGHGAAPAPHGAGSPYAAASPLTPPRSGGPVPPPPIGPEGPGPAPVGPQQPAPWSAPYGAPQTGPVPPPYAAAAQSPAPCGVAHGAGPGYPVAYGYTGWGWPTGLRNGMGDAGLALGIIALVLFIAFPLAMILGVLALIFGGIGHARARRGEAGNRGQALAGMICGGVGLVLATLVLVLVVSTGDEEPNGRMGEGGYSATSVR